jgi:hypothetical protein
MVTHSGSDKSKRVVYHSHGVSTAGRGNGAGITGGGLRGPALGADGLLNHRGAPVLRWKPIDPSILKTGRPARGG